MLPGILLDRDGVINRNRPDHVKSWAEFEFLPGALEALHALSRLGWPIIVLTNQAAVGRGVISLSALDEIHAKMVSAIRHAGGRIDDVLYCPHKPEDGCACRKPAPGLLYEAAKRWRLDLTRSYMIGDAVTDIQAARAVGSRPIMVKTGRGLDQLAALDPLSALQMQVVEDLGASAECILQQCTPSAQQTTSGIARLKPAFIRRATRGALAYR